jgi:hypothetical protein
MVTIFQTSDLAKKRTEFVQAARDGGAHLRDKDGTSYVMMPERRVQSLESLAGWSGRLLRLQDLLGRDDKLPTVAEFGELAWLRVFDRDDLKEFLDELHEVLIASLSDETTEALDDVIHAWRVTAREIEDPLRRSVLTSEHSAADFVDAERPDGG